ncbi:MAG: metal-dependent transcriptional regulator [Acidimicrobiia bacterium]
MDWAVLPGNEAGEAETVEQRCVAAVWELIEEGEQPAAGRLSVHVDVPWSELEAHLADLERAGLARRGTVVELTVDGWQRAAQVVRRRRLAECLLADTVGLPPGRVSAEARWLGPVLNDRTEAALAAVLGEPVRCPHGNPIPVPGDRPTGGLSLTAAGPGRALVVDRIAESVALSPSLEQVLRAGVRPGATVEVIDLRGDVVHLDGEAGRQSLARHVADRIRVS